MTDVKYSYGVGIRVRVLGPTNYKGQRLAVSRADESYNRDPHRITIPWDHGINGSDNAVNAVRHYLAGITGDYADSWQGYPWVVAGSGASEYIAVKVPRSLVESAYLAD